MEKNLKEKKKRTSVRRTVLGNFVIVKFREKTLFTCPLCVARDRPENLSTSLTTKVFRWVTPEGGKDLLICNSCYGAFTNKSTLANPDNDFVKKAIRLKQVNRSVAA